MILGHHRSVAVLSAIPLLAVLSLSTLASLARADEESLKKVVATQQTMIVELQAQMKATQEALERLRTDPSIVRKNSEGKVIADHAATASEAGHAIRAVMADSATRADAATRADLATKADSATTADLATRADSATRANSATTADSATSATHAATAASAGRAGLCDRLQATSPNSVSVTWSGNTLYFNIDSHQKIKSL